MASGLVSAAFPAAAASPLVEPDWGADMVAAARAQALIRLHSEDQPVAASPEHIAVVVDRDAHEALSLLEVTQIPVPTDE